MLYFTGNNRFLLSALNKHQKTKLLHTNNTLNALFVFKLRADGDSDLRTAENTVRRITAQPALSDAEEDGIQVWKFTNNIIHHL